MNTRTITAQIEMSLGHLLSAYLLNVPRFREQSPLYSVEYVCTRIENYVGAYLQRRLDVDGFTAHFILTDVDFLGMDGAAKLDSDVLRRVNPFDDFEEVGTAVRFEEQLFRLIETIVRPLGRGRSISSRYFVYDSPYDGKSWPYQFQYVDSCEIEKLEVGHDPQNVQHYAELRLFLFDKLIERYGADHKLTWTEKYVYVMDK